METDPVRINLPEKRIIVMEWVPFALLFVIGIVAGFTNVMAGGGSTLTVPALIFMGLDSALANGTNRVAIFVQNIFAIWGFSKQGFQQFRMSLAMAVCTIPGAVLGAWVAVAMDHTWFKRILGMVILGVVASMLLPMPKRSMAVEVSESRKWWAYAAMVGIGFYGGFIQVGVGFLLMAVLYHILCLNLVHVNMHKVFIVFIYTIPALGVFIWTGNVNWGLGLVLAAGNATGGWIAAHAAVKGGERVIRWVMIAAIILISLKLFGLF